MCGVCGVWGGGPRILFPLWPISISTTPSPTPTPTPAPTHTPIPPRLLPPVVRGVAAAGAAAPQGLLRLLQENGVPAPLVKCGPCQYRLGGTTAKLTGGTTARLTVRLVNHRLVARAGGAGASVDVLTWLAGQPMAA